MVDWKAAERLRAKGWDWDRIAADPRVGFRADSAAGSGGDLRALYYQHRAEPVPPLTSEGELPMPRPADGSSRRWTLARAGFLLAPFFGVWFALAWGFPSPVGVYFPPIPLLGILFLIASGVLTFGLFRSVEKWNQKFRQTLTIGVVAALVISAGLGVAALSQGCPWLSPLTSAQPGGWMKAPDPAWDAGGPVFFFYGSVACPFCSASSWAIEAALLKFGNLSGTSFGASSPSDQYPNTPEVVLAGASLRSPYVATDFREGTDSSRVTVPAPGGCIEQAYLSAYDITGTIPFIVLGGQYIHAMSLVDPGALAGATAPSLQSQVLNESGPQWNAISSQAFYLMAFLVKLNGGRPASVAQLPAVAADLATIS